VTKIYEGMPCMILRSMEQYPLGIMSLMVLRWVEWYWDSIEESEDERYRTATLAENQKSWKVASVRMLGHMMLPELFFYSKRVVTSCIATVSKSNVLLVPSLLNERDG